MTGNRFMQGRTLWLPLALAGLFALAGGSALAASDTPPTSQVPGATVPDTLSHGSPPDMAKPIAPGKSEKVDSAFKKLDPTGKGYVAKEDAKVLDGFDPIFDKADTKHEGKLNYSQFKKAWREYANEKPMGAGKAAY